MSFEERIFYPSPPSNPTPEFKSSTLILPSISIGNVPQLAVDLLITTLGLPLVGYMTSPYLVPCAGTLETATSLGQGGIACPLEGMSFFEYLVVVICLGCLFHSWLSEWWLMGSLFRQGEERYRGTTTKSIYFKTVENTFRKRFMAVYFLLWV